MYIWSSITQQDLALNMES